MVGWGACRPFYFSLRSPADALLRGLSACRPAPFSGSSRSPDPLSLGSVRTPYAVHGRTAENSKLPPIRSRTTNQRPAAKKPEDVTLGRGPQPIPTPTWVQSAREIGCHQTASTLKPTSWPQQSSASLVNSPLTPTRDRNSRAAYNYPLGPVGTG